MSFGELRSLLHDPGEDAWHRMCRHLESVPTGEIPQTLTYCDALLSSWPDRWRTCPSRWTRRYLRREPAPWLGLGRAMRVPLDSQADRGWLHRLVAAPELSELRELDLSLLSLGPDAALTLHDNLRLPRLHTLRLAGNELGPEGAIDLAGAPWMPALRELDLYNNGLDLLSITALLDASWPELERLRLAANPLGTFRPPILSGEHAPRLSTLDLNGCELTHLDLDLPGLTHLSLDRNTLGDAGLEALCQAPPPGLQDLQLGQNQILGTGQGVRPIEGLRRLGLWKNGLGDGGLAKLRARGLFDTLEALSLADNKLGPEALGRGLPPGLAELDVTWNPVGDDLHTGLQALTNLRALRANHCDLSDEGLTPLLTTHAGLRTLDLTGNHLNATSAHALASLSLQELHVRGNTLGAHGAQILAEAPALAGLHTLDLTNNDLGPRGAQALADSPHLRGLRVLHLRANAIGDAGLLALLESPNLRDLRALYLSDNDIGDTGARRLAASTHLDRLRILHLNRNPIGPGAVATLRQAPHLRHLQTLWLPRP